MRVSDMTSQMDIVRHVHSFLSIASFECIGSWVRFPIFISRRRRPNCVCVWSIAMRKKDDVTWHGGCGDKYYCCACSIVLWPSNCLFLLSIPFFFFARAKKGIISTCSSDLLFLGLNLYKEPSEWVSEKELLGCCCWLYKYSQVEEEGVKKLLVLL